MIVVVLSIMMVGIIVATGWAALREEAGDGAAPPRDPDPAPEVATLEGVLVGQLLAGEISGPQYRRAMQRLAERDADRHPLSVPPDA